MKKKYYILLFLMLFLFPIVSFASGKDINVHLFYDKTCPHCEAEMEWFSEYLKENTDVHLYKYEVSENFSNLQNFRNVKKLLNNNSSGVPFLVIGNQAVVGYDESGTTTSENIKTIINYYRHHPYRDEVGEFLGITPVDDSVSNENIDILEDNLNIPIFGNINPKNVSLPLIAVVIGATDGFNPCAMWILIFLITMLMGMKNRKKMWILGLTFLFTSGIVYLMFMLSWLSFASVLNKVKIIKLLLGLFACIFGIINIYNYIKSLNADTGCEVVDDKKRKKIIKSISKIVTEKKFILSLVGVIVLAIGVNIIELLCSLGLPVLFTQILSMNNLSTLEYMIYMLIYIVFFMLDDFIVFFIAMKTLKIKAISNKYTKYSHLIGGIIMLIIGILMILKPEWLMFNF